MNIFLIIIMCLSLLALISCLISIHLTKKFQEKYDSLNTDYTILETELKFCEELYETTKQELDKIKKQVNKPTKRNVKSKKQVEEKNNG